ncbi:hypothetical protein ACS0TY_032154 [Phlomoides rotata]
MIVVEHCQQCSTSQQISWRVMDGDIVSINRPPTTHKHSLQAFPLKQRQRCWSFSQWRNNCLASTLVTSTCSWQLTHCCLSRYSSKTIS